MNTRFITPYGNATPEIHPEAYVDVSARIIGKVVIAERAGIWPMVVLRADSAEISIGRGAAVLDLALIESPEGHPARVEEGALISHGAILHGATVQSGALVGIGAIVLDGAVVSSGSIVGAGSLVTAGTQIPPNSLVMGTPARVVRQTTEKERRNIAVQIEGLYRKSRPLMKQDSAEDR